MASRDPLENNRLERFSIDITPLFEEGFLSDSCCKWSPWIHNLQTFSRFLWGILLWIALSREKLEMIDLQPAKEGATKTNHFFGRRGYIIRRSLSRAVTMSSLAWNISSGECLNCPWKSSSEVLSHWGNQVLSSGSFFQSVCHIKFKILPRQTCFNISLLI